MTVKEWLSRGINIDKEIESLQEASAQAFQAAQNTGQEFNAVQSGKQGSSENRQEIKLIRYIQLSDKLKTRLQEREKTKAEIEKIIGSIDKPIHRALLNYRYLCGYSWEKIAEKIDMSDRWTRTRLHSDALNAAEKILKKQKKL